MLGCLKTFWREISTGWVVEYPGRSQDGPNDFFDRRDRRPQGVAVPLGSESEWRRDSGSENADAIFKWQKQQEQLRDAGK